MKEGIAVLTTLNQLLDSALVRDARPCGMRRAAGRHGHTDTKINRRRRERCYVLQPHSGGADIPRLKLRPTKRKSIEYLVQNYIPIAIRIRSITWSPAGDIYKAPAGPRTHCWYVVVCGHSHARVGLPVALTSQSSHLTGDELV